jgi:hypothetical protein
MGSTKGTGTPSRRGAGVVLIVSIRSTSTWVGLGRGDCGTTRLPISYEDASGIAGSPLAVSARTSKLQPVLEAQGGMVGEEASAGVSAQSSHRGIRRRRTAPSAAIQMQRSLVRSVLPHTGPTFADGEDPSSNR